MGYIFIFVFVLILNTHIHVESKTFEITAHKFEKAVDDLLDLGNLKVYFSKDIEDQHKLLEDEIEKQKFCDTCRTVINKVILFRKNGADKKSMYTALQSLCSKVTDWGAIACNGYIDIEIDTILYILDNSKGLTASKICATKFQWKNCTSVETDISWDSNLKLPIKAVVQQSQTNNEISSNPLKVLQITDVHYDPRYTPGNNAKCDLPLCCEDINGLPENPANAAGKWGDYNFCDMPWHSILDLVAEIKNSHKQIDMIYFTGDIISHRSWATSITNNTQAIRDLYKLFRDEFEGISIYPILGNHESHPTDFFSPENVDGSVATQWIFKLAAEEWASWLPEDTKSTILKGGYYTVLIRPGFRIIALNSNVCFIENLWLVYDAIDPYNQLKWLIETLLQAETKGEIVHILSHIPPGDSMCYKEWARQFARIINRFSNIIVGQFNGHTHLDEFRLFYDRKETNKVVNVAYNAGSFTTFVGYNPNYRLYEVDAKTMRVSDYDHFIYNLTEANQSKGPPRWYKLYSFKDAYDLEDLSHENLGNLISRMAKNHTLIQQYYRFQVRDSDIHMRNECDDKCLFSLLCQITSVEVEKSIQCTQLETLYFN